MLILATDALSKFNTGRLPSLADDIQTSVYSTQPQFWGKLLAFGGAPLPSLPSPALHPLPFYPLPLEVGPLKSS